jgi:hypothetical protein
MMRITGGVSLDELETPCGEVDETTCAFWGVDDNGSYLVWAHGDPLRVSEVFCIHGSQQGRVTARLMAEAQVAVDQFILEEA